MPTLLDDDPGGFEQTDQTMLFDDEERVDDEDEKMEEDWEGRKPIRVKWTFLGPKTAEETANAFGELAENIASQFNPIKFVNSTSKVLRNMNWTSHPNQINKHFKIHDDTRLKQSRFYVIHDILAHVSLSTIKQDKKIREILQRHRIYGDYHEFEIEEWNISRIGFFHKAHINHITAQYLFDHLRKLIMEKAPTDLTKFQIAPTRVRLGRNPEDNIRAYELLVPRDNARTFSRLVMSATIADPIFTPYKLKADKPELFQKAIQSQKEVHSETYVIKLEGFTARMILYIKQATTNISGIMDIIPTHNKSAHGEHKVLVPRTSFSATFKAIRQEWKQIVSNIPQELFDDIPYTYEYPKITSQTPADDEDNSAESYVSDLTASLHTVRTTASDNTTITNKSVRWTDIVVNKNKTAPSTTSTFTQAEFETMGQRIRELEEELNQLKMAKPQPDQNDMQKYWPLFCQFMQQMEIQNNNNTQVEKTNDKSTLDEASLPKKRPAENRPGNINEYLVPLTRSHKRKPTLKRTSKITELTDLRRDDE